MLVTIISSRPINGHYNYKVKDQQGNTHIVKGLNQQLELNKQYNLNIEVIEQSAEYRKEIKYYKTKAKAIQECNNYDEFIKYMAGYGYNCLHVKFEK